MNVSINGTVRQVPADSTLAAVLADLLPSTRWVAVVRNGAVVPGSTWAAVALHDGDRIEVLTPRQGG